MENFIQALLNPWRFPPFNTSNGNALNQVLAPHSQRDFDTSSLLKTRLFLGV
jgi:hypothetical protein